MLSPVSTGIGDQLAMSSGGYTTSVLGRSMSPSQLGQLSLASLCGRKWHRLSPKQECSIGFVRWRQFLPSIIQYSLRFNWAHHTNLSCIPQTASRSIQTILQLSPCHQSQRNK